MKQIRTYSFLCDHVNLTPLFIAQSFLIEISTKENHGNVRLPRRINYFILIAEVISGNVTIENSLYTRNHLITVRIQPGTNITYNHLILRGFLIPAQAYTGIPSSKDNKKIVKKSSIDLNNSILKKYIRYTISRNKNARNDNEFIYQKLLREITKTFLKSQNINRDYPPKGKNHPEIWLYSNSGESEILPPPKNRSSAQKAFTKISLQRAFWEIARGMGSANLKNIAFRYGHSNQHRFSIEFRKVFFITPGDLNQYLLTNTINKRNLKKILISLIWI